MCTNWSKYAGTGESDGRVEAEMASVQASHREDRFMEDIRGALKSKNYTVKIPDA